MCACTCTPYQHCCCGGEVVRHGLGAIYEHVLPGLNQDTQWQTPGKISCRLLSRAFWCFHSEEIVRCRFWKTFEHSVSTELAHDVQCMQTIVANILHFAFDEALRPSIADDPRYTANPCTNPTVFFFSKKTRLGKVLYGTVPIPGWEFPCFSRTRFQQFCEWIAKSFLEAFQQFCAMAF